MRNDDVITQLEPPFIFFFLAEVGVDGNILGKKVKAAVSAAAQATGGIHFHSGGNKVEDRVETRMGDEGPNGNSPESTAKEGVSSRFADNIEVYKRVI